MQEKSGKDRELSEPYTKVRTIYITMKTEFKYHIDLTNILKHTKYFPGDQLAIQFILMLVNYFFRLIMTHMLRPWITYNVGLRLI